MIEKECLLWLAGHWGVDTKELDDNDELERALRIRIAEEASQYLLSLIHISEPTRPY